MLFLVQLIFRCSLMHSMFKMKCTYSLYIPFALDHSIILKPWLCRWNFTPLDDAIKFGHKEIQKILESYIEEETEHTLKDNNKKEESWTCSPILTFYSNILFITFLKNYLPFRIFMSVVLLQSYLPFWQNKTLCQYFIVIRLSFFENFMSVA